MAPVASWTITLSAVTADSGLPALRPAREHVDLGLPLGKATRLRSVKQLVYRVSWLFLNHQVTVNRSVIEAIDELTRRHDDLARAVAALSTALDEQVQAGLRQVSMEIGHHIASTQSEIARLALQLAGLKGELATLRRTAQPSVDDPTVDNTV